MTPSSSPTPSRWHWPSAIAGLLIGAILVSAGLFVLRRPPTDPIVIHTAADETGRLSTPIQLTEDEPTDTPTPSPTPTATPTPAEIIVFVSGAVVNPGNYRLPPGARAGDALAAAGGFAPDAQTDAVNLAAVVQDGQQVDFPAKDEPIPTPTSTPTPTFTPTPTDTPTPEPVAGRQGGVTLDGCGPVNVNTATQAELETLPGIGPVKAQAIMDNRPYASIDELNRVPGIGDATFAQIQPCVTVE